MVRRVRADVLFFTDMADIRKLEKETGVRAQPSPPIKKYLPITCICSIMSHLKNLQGQFLILLNYEY